MSPAKITCKISLGILPVWSETSMWAKWITVDQFFLHMDSEDFEQTELMPRLIRVFSRRTTTLLVFLFRGTHDCCTWPYSFIAQTSNENLDEPAILCYLTTVLVFADVTQNVNKEESNVPQLVTLICKELVNFYVYWGTLKAHHSLSLSHDWFEDVFFIIFILLQNGPWFAMISICSCCSFLRNIDVSVFQQLSSDKCEFNSIWKQTLLGGSQMS